jgi:hypothetical protein
VLGLVPIDTAMKTRLQNALAAVLTPPLPARPRHHETRAPDAKRAGGRAR